MQKNLKNIKRVNRHKHENVFSFTVLIICVIFLLLPLFTIILFSFNESNQSVFTSFSLHWYKELFFNSRNLFQALANSLFIAITAGAASTFLGTLAAIGTGLNKQSKSTFVNLITFLPLVLPEVIVGISLVMFFSKISLSLNLFTIFLAHTTFCLPFVYLTVQSRMQGFDFTITEAARDLGATERQTLTKIIIPTIAPSIYSGFILAITMSLEDFIITFFVSGPGSTTLPLYIFSLIRFGITPVINALSFFIILTLSLSVLTMKRFVKNLASSR